MANEKTPTAGRVAISRKQIGGEAPMVVSEVTDECLYTGFFGTLDSARVQLVTERILGLLDSSSYSIIIIDLGNVDMLDSAVAAHLTRLGDTLKLVGVEVLFCGVSGILANTMVTAGVRFESYRVSRNFKSALIEMFSIQGLEVVPIRGTD